MELDIRVPAVYVRQSIDKKDSISIESQIEACRSKLSADEKFKVYEDKGYSGKNTLRQKFIEMMNDVRAERISKVIIYRLDRISRAILDFASMIEVFDKHNVSIISCNDPIDTTTPMGRAMINVAMVFAQLERETIQERVRDNYYARGKDGFYMGGFAPIGYKKIETSHNGKKTYTFEPDGNIAELVKYLFDEYATKDVSLSALCTNVNKSGMYTNKDKPWTAVSMGRLLRNPVYVMADADVYLYLKNKGATMNNDVEDYIGRNGCYLYGDRKKVTYYKFTNMSHCFATVALHEGLVDSETWIACQNKMDKNKQIKNSGRGSHTWLSGIIKCGYCKMAVTILNGYRDKKYITCGGRKNRICFDRKKSYVIEDIEAQVESELMEEIKHKVNEDMLTSKQKDSPEVNQWKIQLVKIEESINSLVSKIPMASNAAMKYINESIDKLDSDKQSLLEKISASINKTSKTSIPLGDLIDAMENWNTLSLDKKKKVAKSFISEIYLTDEFVDVNFFDTRDIKIDAL